MCAMMNTKKKIEEKIITQGQNTGTKCVVTMRLLLPAFPRRRHIAFIVPPKQNECKNGTKTHILTLHARIHLILTFFRLCSRPFSRKIIATNAKNAVSDEKNVREETQNEPLPNSDTRKMKNKKSE